MQVLSGTELAGALTAGFNCLQRYRDPINALNVYPVPDGDTGTNMMLTMRAGVEKLGGTDGPTAGEVAAQMADGTFWEARGNSGVILSQFFKGIAQGLEGKEVCGCSELAQAFRSATEAAYKSVGNPVEGTMLTVIRCVAEALESSIESQGGGDVLESWETGYNASREALDATPSLLPKLREAGVVDAGGMGIVVILGGAYLHLTGEAVDDADLGLVTSAGQIDPSQLSSVSVESDFLDSSVESDWGYCTQFMIQGENLDIEQVREDLAKTAESLVIIGDDRFIKVHVHVEDPGMALTYGVSLGELAQIKIDNMSLQNQDWASGHQERNAPKSGVALVAVAPGDGLAQLFRETANASVVSGGQTMNPSVAQLINAAEASGGENVILLPNNKNVAITANQATDRENETQILHVIPTTTVSQGIAAALAFNPEATAEQNLAAMNDAVSAVVSIEVTQAIRDTTVEGTPVAEGDYMGLVEGKLTVLEASAESALLAALAGAALTDDHIVTIYWGLDTDEETTQAVAERIEEQTPGIQVDLVYGGQPHYHYFASVE
jgi:DAK2 domain fusion protein YloV